MSEAVQSKNPYPGLRPFDTEDADYFFGRDRQVDELLLALRDHRFVAVLGLSGSGKSSLVQAGLVPALKAGHLISAGPHWRIAPFRPGRQPLEALAAALDESLGIQSGRFESLCTTTNALLVNTCEGRDPKENLLVVVDQFEEIFRVTDARQAAHFIDLLLAAEQAISPSFRVYVVLTMRTDRLGECVRFEGLPEALNRSQYLVPRLANEQLREAIEGPAALTDTAIAPDLAQRLTIEASEDRDQLPLLQHLLMVLWERRQITSDGLSLISLNEYATVRSAANALNDHANQVLRHLAPNQLPLAGLIFRALIEVGEGRDQRRPQRLSELAKATGATREDVLMVVEHFRKANFLSSPDRGRTPDWEVDITHESLIRQWEQLKDWVNQESQSASAYKRLVDAALNNRSLYDGRNLEEALIWEKRESPNSDWAFRYDGDPGVFKKSIQFLRRSERKHRVTRVKLAALVALVAFALGVAITFFLMYQKSERQAQLAKSRHLAAVALLHRDDQVDLASLLSIEAFQVADTFEARSALLEMNQSRIQVFSTLHESGGIKSVAFSPDGKILALASADQTIRLWDVAGHRPLGEPLSGHNGSVVSVSFSPDGKILASASADKTIRLWSVAVRQTIGEPLRGHTDSVRSVAFSPDGKILASGSSDKTVRLWSVASHQTIGEPLRGHTDSVRSVAFSPDGKTLASSSEDKTVQLWHLATRRPSGEPLRGHNDSVESVAFSPDGKILASASVDQSVQLWDVAAHRPLGEPLRCHSGSVEGIAFSPDGKTLASANADKTVRLWDVPTRQLLNEPLRGHSGSVDGVAFSPDGRVLASASADKTVQLWNLVPQEPLGGSLRGHTGIVYSVVFSPDGKTLASASADTTVQLWNVVSRQPLGDPLRGHTKPVYSVVFSPDGKTLASASADKTVRLWDVATHQPIGEPLLSHERSVYNVAFSPDGKTLASASADKTVRLWDVATRQPTGEPLRGHTGFVESVAFSPDGKTLASASADKTVRLWDVATRQPIGKPLRGHTDFVDSVAFSPDGKVLASASVDQTIQMWDVAMRQRLGGPLQRHSGSVVSVAFSPDGALLASASTDRTIQLWDVATRQSLGESLLYNNSVESVAFSRDGKVLASGDDEKVVQLLDLDPASWKMRACQRANRNLSFAEWQQYMGRDVGYSKTCPELQAGEGVSEQ